MDDAGGVCVIGLDENLECIEVFRVSAEYLQGEDVLDAHAMPVMGVEAICATEVRDA